MKPRRGSVRQWLAVLLLMSGCVTLERSYPEKHFYALELPRGIKSVNGAAKGVMQISYVRISPRYQGKNFIYRLSDRSFESDFYNEFLIDPASLIAEELRKGLARSGLFQYVVDSSSELAPTYSLEPAVNALYGDFRNSSAPKAVLEMEFFVVKQNSRKSDITMQKRYAKAVALDGRSPDALVKGWDEALGQILNDLITDLKAANL
jgi:ABC-type uncharacterized transport system auxiliary subunit